MIKFLEDHAYSGGTLNVLRACVKALEQEQSQEAVRLYRSVPLGGNGTFTDWYPEKLLPNETAEYVEAVFDALVSRWSFWMKL
ncbi:MAG: hypothetical protein WCI73_00870 [Phycisphaerae bacterium]